METVENTNTEKPAIAISGGYVSARIECGFCSWSGIKSQLEKNGHCPSCQSPTTKRYDCKHKKLDSIQGFGVTKGQKCKDCLTIIYLK